MWNDELLFIKFLCVALWYISLFLLGIAEMASAFLAIYLMLIVKRKTDNAWGCVFAFLFIWNAF